MGKLVALAVAGRHGRGGGPGPGGGRGRRVGGPTGSAPSPVRHRRRRAAPDPAVIQPGPAIPAGWLPLYQQAAATCPGLSWSVLAAVGTVETRQRAVDRPRGVVRAPTPPGPRGRCSSSRPPSPPTPPSGPAGPGRRPPTTRWTPSTPPRPCCAPTAAGAGATLRAAIEDYNHSDTYVDTVLTLSLAFAEDPTVSGTVVAALSFAARQLGTPYLWGGTGAGGFDCSGLAQAAYRQRGHRPPPGGPGPVRRRAGRSPPARPSQPGDLVFFGSGPGRRRPRRPLRRGRRDDRRPPHRGPGPLRRRRLARAGRGHPAGMSAGDLGSSGIGQSPSGELC